MNAQDLKNSILQLAVQGKLVEQRAEEGTARELLEQIKLEKDQLIKDKKIKKSKPLPEIMEDEIPFEIPESWEWVRLEDICTKLVDGDHNPPKGVDEKTDYIMASSTNINNNTIVDIEKVRYLTQDIFEKENERTQATDGDIFFTSVGTLGRSCVYKGGYNICFQRSVSVIRTLILNYYLKYTFDSAYFQYKIIREATGTAQKGFYLKQLAMSLIPIPPLEEQYRIVAKIEEILPYIDQYDKAYTKLETFNKKFPEDMKKSILQMAMQGKLVEQRPEEGTADELYEQIVAEKAQLIKDGNIDKVCNLNLRRKVEELRREFYINCCVVLDKSHPKNKRKICEDKLIEAIYYERDKNCAHRDDDYKSPEFNQLRDMIETMKHQIQQVLVVCKDSLPNNITLDFVSHDKELFRLIYGITAEKEEEIKHRKYVS